VQYANGAKMTYSLNAFMPWEGYTIAFNGRKGRLEHHCEETVYISETGSVPRRAESKRDDHPTSIRHFAPAYEVQCAGRGRSWRRRRPDAKRHLQPRRHCGPVRAHPPISALAPTRSSQASRRIIPLIGATVKIEIWGQRV